MSQHLMLFDRVYNTTFFSDIDRGKIVNDLGLHWTTLDRFLCRLWVIITKQTGIKMTNDLYFHAHTLMQRLYRYTAIGATGLTQLYTIYDEYFKTCELLANNTRKIIRCMDIILPN